MTFCWPRSTCVTGPLRPRNSFPCRNAWRFLRDCAIGCRDRASGAIWSNRVLLRTQLNRVSGQAAKRRPWKVSPTVRATSIWGSWWMAQRVRPSNLQMEPTLLPRSRVAARAAHLARLDGLGQRDWQCLFFARQNVAAIAGKTSFVGGGADAAFIADAYAGNCIAAGCALSRSRMSRVFACGLASAALVVLGFIFGTVGALGVALIAAEFEPARAGTLREGHRYEIVAFGNATSNDGGLVVNIYRSSRGLPLVERRVFSRRYVGTELSDLRVEDRDGSRGAVVLANGSPPTAVAFD